MKRFVVLFIGILLLLVMPKVYAKDTVYSLNKYDKEEYKYIIKDQNGGYLTLGTYEQEKEKHILIVDYKKDGSIRWQLNNKEYDAEELYGVTNSYGEDGKINSYLLVVKKDSFKFWKINLDGEFIEEKETNLYGTVELESIIETTDKTGYLLFGTIDAKAFIAKYDESLNLIWIKTYDNMKKIKELVDEYEAGYYGIVEVDDTYKLIKFDHEGNEISTIKEDFELITNPHLLQRDDSYLVYGYTTDVKLNNTDSGSYFIIRYGLDDNIIWETIGDEPVDDNKLIRLEETNHNYYLLHTNSNDNSIEVSRINEDGVIEEKVKKLKNDYYDMNDFIFNHNVLYFIGQINCPEEDNCDYNAKSLLLVSSEDKVIEVEDKDSKNILITTGIIIVLTGILYFYKKKKKLKK